MLIKVAAAVVALAITMPAAHAASTLDVACLLDVSKCKKKSFIVLASTTKWRHAGSATISVVPPLVNPCPELGRRAANCIDPFGSETEPTIFDLAYDSSPFAGYLFEQNSQPAWQHFEHAPAWDVSYAGPRDWAAPVPLLPFE